MMACGVPVITTTNCSAEDILTDGVEGFIVPARDPDAIREKVVYLYENPDVRAAMSEAALRRVRTVGGWETYGENACARYKEAFRSFRAKIRTDRSNNQT